MDRERRHVPHIYGFLLEVLGLNNTSLGSKTLTARKSPASRRPIDPKLSGLGRVTMPQWKGMWHSLVFLEIYGYPLVKGGLGYDSACIQNLFLAVGKPHWWGT